MSFRIDQPSPSVLLPPWTAITEADARRCDPRYDWERAKGRRGVRDFSASVTFSPAAESDARSEFGLLRETMILEFHVRAVVPTKSDVRVRYEGAALSCSRRAERILCFVQHQLRVNSRRFHTVLLDTIGMIDRRDKIVN